MVGPWSVRMPSYSGEPCVNICVGNLALPDGAGLASASLSRMERFETARIMTDPRDRPLRGFGFVEMPESHARVAPLTPSTARHSLAARSRFNEARPREPNHASRAGKPLRAVSCWP